MLCHESKKSVDVSRFGIGSSREASTTPVLPGSIEALGCSSPHFFIKAIVDFRFGSGCNSTFKQRYGQGAGGRPNTFAFISVFPFFRFSVFRFPMNRHRHNGVARNIGLRCHEGVCLSVRLS